MNSCLSSLTVRPLWSNTFIIKCHEHTPGSCQSNWLMLPALWNVLSSLIMPSTSQQEDAGTWPYFSTWHQEKRLYPKESLIVVRERSLCSVFLSGESASSQYGGMGHVGSSVQGFCKAIILGDFHQMSLFHDLGFQLFSTRALISA